MRQSPTGLFVYDETGRREIPLPLDRDPRTLMLTEFCEAVLGIACPVHDGR